jgi:hypothetical protein
MTVEREVEAFVYVLCLKFADIDRAIIQVTYVLKPELKFFSCADPFMGNSDFDHYVERAVERFLPVDRMKCDESIRPQLIKAQEKTTSKIYNLVNKELGTTEVKAFADKYVFIHESEV